MPGRINLASFTKMNNTRLTYIKDIARKNPNNRRCEFLCDCGNIVNTELAWVRHGSVSSCGCYKRDKLVEKNSKHGCAVRKNKGGAYRSWQALKQRAGNKKNYLHVSVSEEWLGESGFSNFLRDMGDRPIGHSIDRIDNRKGYEPSNCKWSTRSEQSRNTKTTKFVTIHGETRCIADWCLIKGISYGLVKERRQKGMSLIDALTKPINTFKRNKLYRIIENLLNSKQILVFSSSVDGKYWAGSSLYARKHYGAVYGVGVGRTGQCYAIPTKDSNIRTLPLDAIFNYVHEFLRYARANPDLRFFVTRIGCGLAGYKDEQIAPMFKGAPDNCGLPEEWKEYIKERNDEDQFSTEAE